MCRWYVVHGHHQEFDPPLQQHNDGVASRYTRSRRPVKLVYQEPQRGQSLALKREAAINKLTRRQKLAMIRGADKGTPTGCTSRKRQAP